MRAFTITSILTLVRNRVQRRIGIGGDRCLQACESAGHILREQGNRGRTTIVWRVIADAPLFFDG